MGNTGLFTHDHVREIVGLALAKASSGMTDKAFAASIDASPSAVAVWRNQQAEMGAYFLTNLMKTHPGFLAEYLWALGYKPVALTEAECDDKEFTVALATLQLKHAKAMIDGRVDHKELFDMEPELDEVDEGIDERKAMIRRLRSSVVGKNVAAHA